MAIHMVKPRLVFPATVSPRCFMNSKPCFWRNALVFVALLCLTGLSFSASAATYYVRTDGGPATQCNGTANAPASAAPNCAWNSLMEALPPNWLHAEAARIKGGDTVIIAAGSYPIGWQKGYYQRWGDNCAAQYAPACHPQVIPSGTVAQPTRILGAGWDTGCTAPPELWGTQGPNTVLSLDGASNVVIACLSVTDHAYCTLNYRPNSSYSCPGKATGTGDNDPGLGSYAPVGLHAQDSNNVTLQDMSFHGLADQGVQAGRISNWTVTRVKVLGNGNVGWNGDLGGNNQNSSNSGNLTFTDLTVAWNGCQEHYPVDGGYDLCYGQEQGGYGDGLGEAWTGGVWTFIRPKFYRNISDGLDLLYANGTGSITIDQGYFAYNVGNDLKTAGPAKITNSVFIANCSVFKGTSQPVAPNPCRAGGGEFADFTATGQTITFAYNTVVGEPGCLFGGDPSGTSQTGGATLNKSDVVNIQNNVFIGKPKWNGDGQSCLVYYGDTPPMTINWLNNVVWNVRSNECPSTSICKDPLLTDESLATFNPNPLVSSPAIGNAAAGAVNPAWDYNGNPRPTSRATIGAIQYRGQVYMGSGTGDSPPVPSGGGATPSADAPVPQPPGVAHADPIPATGAGTTLQPQRLHNERLQDGLRAERYYRRGNPDQRDALRVERLPQAEQTPTQQADATRPVRAAETAVPVAEVVSQQPVRRSYAVVVYGWFTGVYDRFRRLFAY